VLFSLSWIQNGAEFRIAVKSELGREAP
jgi:hypothetical protein